MQRRKHRNAEHWELPYRGVLDKSSVYKNWTKARCFYSILSQGRQLLCQSFMKSNCSKLAWAAGGEKVQMRRQKSYSHLSTTANGLNHPTRTVQARRQKPPNNIIQLRDRAGTILTFPVPECSGGLNIKTCGVIVESRQGVNRQTKQIGNHQEILENIY